jgi:hypothetical protein
VNFEFISARLAELHRFRRAGAPEDEQPGVNGPGRNRVGGEVFDAVDDLFE